jgi:two-component sensor histidine kinase/DNA-binding NarL/FixJ family response regulator
MRILIVDDNGSGLDETMGRLQRAFEPVECVAVRDAETYTRCLEQGPIDLVLTEAVLGWSTGLNVLRDVQSRLPGVPVIMVTGSGSETLAVDGFKAGLADYVPKDHLERLEPAVRDALHKRPPELTGELDILRRIQEVSTRLIQTDNIETLYQEILDTTMAILRADFGSIQKYRPEGDDAGQLQLIRQRGFNREAAELWEWVRPDSCTTCGKALHTRQRVMVPDIRTCEFMAGSEDQATYLQTGILAVQSTPLLSRSGEFIGMLSTHWRRPYEATTTELRALDIMARLAADLIQRRQADEELRRHTAELEQLNEANRALLGEVNHRVKNSLTAILGLIFAEQRRLKAEPALNGGLPRCQTALSDLNKRVRNLATVHELLASSQWRPLRSDVLIGQLIRDALPAGIHTPRLNLSITGEPILLSPEQAHHLALVISELAMNTAKHRPGRGTLHITVDVTLQGGEVQLTYRSGGSEYPSDVLAGQGHSVGLELIKTITTHSLRGAWSIRNENGAVTEIRFPLSVPALNGWRAPQAH